MTIRDVRELLHQRVADVRGPAIDAGRADPGLAAERDRHADLAVRADQLLLTGDTQSRVEGLLGPPDTAFEHYVQGSRQLERVLHYRTGGHYLTVFLQEGLVRSFRTGRAPWRYGSGGSTD